MCDFINASTEHTRRRAFYTGVMVLVATFKKYFSYIVAVSFIGEGNRSTRRKSLTALYTIGKTLKRTLITNRASRDTLVRFSINRGQYPLLWCSLLKIVLNKFSWVINCTFDKTNGLQIHIISSSKQNNDVNCCKNVFFWINTAILVKPTTIRSRSSHPLCK